MQTVEQAQQALDTAREELRRAEAAGARSLVLEGLGVDVAEAAAALAEVRAPAGERLATCPRCAKPGATAIHAMWCDWQPA